MRYKSGILVLCVLLSSSFVLANTNVVSNQIGQTSLGEEPSIQGRVAEIRVGLNAASNADGPSPAFLLLSLQETQARLALINTEKTAALNFALFEYAITIHETFYGDLDSAYNDLSNEQQEVYVELLTLLIDLEEILVMGEVPEQLYTKLL